MDGHDYVDLGLPSGTKWATYNVGATKPSEYGDYFAWGETKPKEKYTPETYKWCTVDSEGWYAEFTKYNTYSDNGTVDVDNKTVLDAKDDATTANWGSAWRMPTTEEIDELIESCDWKWVMSFNGSGVSGQLGTSKKNGATIFLPAAGFRKGTVLISASGHYWSSSLFDGRHPYSANYIFFIDGYIGSFINDDRSLGQSVRAVLR